MPLPGDGACVDKSALEQRDGGPVGGGGVGGGGLVGGRAFSPNKHVWKRSSFEVNLLVNSTYSMRHKRSTDVQMRVCVCVHTLPLSVK